MGIEQLLEELANEELADISLYAGEAKLFAEKLVAGERIARLFADFAAQEKEHALALMAIAGKTGEPQARNIPVGGSLREALRRHAEREALGLTIYNKLLGQLDDPAQKLVIKGIIAQESEHLRAAKDYLQKIRDANE